MLLLTQADVDKTNKSYYGETGLILLSAAGNFDCRVTLGTVSQTIPPRLIAKYHSR